jgi:hypothetical protein
VLALSTAGCGGGGSKPLSRADYLKQVNSIAEQPAPSESAIALALTSPSAAATALTNAQAALKTTESKLSAITPPDAIKAQHDQLVKALGELANELPPVIAQLKASDLGALRKATSLKGVVDARAALAALTKAGYKITLPVGG